MQQLQSMKCQYGVDFKTLYLKSFYIFIVQYDKYSLSNCKVGGLYSTWAKMEKKSQILWRINESDRFFFVTFLKWILFRGKPQVAVWFKGYEGKNQTTNTHEFVLDRDKAALTIVCYIIKESGFCQICQVFTAKNSSFVHVRATVGSKVSSASLSFSF